MAGTTYNVVIVKRDALTVSFTGEGFFKVVEQVAKMAADKWYGLHENDPVFIGCASHGRCEYEVGELVTMARGQEVQ